MDIKFTPINKEAELYVEKPISAGQLLPKWYREIPAFDTKTPTYDSDGKTNQTLKQCVPFADSLKFGYLQKTWQDIKIQNIGSESFNYYYPSSPHILKTRAKTHLPKDFLNKYYKDEFIWYMPWLPKLPKGYSALITHPLNREDLPFRTLTGVIDADEYFHEEKALLPFLVNKNFDGVIPVGTPMYQIIPFKRDDWISSTEKFNEELQSNGRKIHSIFWGGYKKLIWKKKNFD